MKPVSNDQFSAEFLDRYLAGEASVGEAETVRAWMSANETREREVISFGGAPEGDTNAAWNNIVTRVRDSTETVVRDISGSAELAPRQNPESGGRWVGRVRGTAASGMGKGRVYSRSSVPRWVGYTYAATVFLLAVVAIQYISQVDSTATPLIPKTYATNPGQRATVTLSDGSRVTLGPATILRIKQQRSSVQLSVDVAGEALFSVNANRKHPFAVTAHGVTTRVLGTQFVVCAYDASKVRIAVRNGKVSVQSPALTVANAVVVSANQAVSVIPDAAPRVVTITDLAADFAWADGQLVLHNVSLGEALIRMSRWYGREFRVSDSTLLDLRVEAVLPSNYNASRIAGFARVLDAQVTQSGPIITFSPNP